MADFVPNLIDLVAFVAFPLHFVNGWVGVDLFGQVVQIYNQVRSCFLLHLIVVQVIFRFGTINMNDIAAFACSCFLCLLRWWWFIITQIYNVGSFHGDVSSCQFSVIQSLSRNVPFTGGASPRLPKTQQDLNMWFLNCTSAKNHVRRRRSIKEVETEEEVTFWNYWYTWWASRVESAWKVEDEQTFWAANNYNFTDVLVCKIHCSKFEVLVWYVRYVVHTTTQY